MGEGAAPGYDLVVVGGGPAGQAACLALQGRLRRIAVIDEQPRPGGQILRQPPAPFSVRNWLPGAGYRRLKAQLSAFEALDNVEWLGGYAVLSVTPTDGGWRVMFADGRKAQSIVARRVLIAAGCYDMAIPVPGWTLPGVMSAGGAQAFVKSQRLVPGRRIALAGSHPLQLLTAAQIIEAGGEVAVVAFAQGLGEAAGEVLARPATALGHLPQLLTALGLGLRLIMSGVPLRFGRRPLAAVGETEVRALRLEGAGEISCDAVAFCFGFLPQSDLPRAMGMQVDPAEGGGWAARADAWMRSSLAGVYVAGETAGVKGAHGASAEGALAGLGVALDAGVITPDQARREAARPRRRRAAALRFSALLATVANPDRIWAEDPPADTVICRCEDVTLGALDAARAVCPGADAVKLSTRCGMGPCQGRNCEHILLRRMAGKGMNPKGFTARWPTRPIRIGDLLADCLLR